MSVTDRPWPLAPLLCGFLAGIGAPIALAWNLAEADTLGELVAAVWFLPAPVAMGAAALAGLVAALITPAPGAIVYRSVVCGAALGAGTIAAALLAMTLVGEGGIGSSPAEGLVAITVVAVLLNAVGAAAGVIAGALVRAGVTQVRAE